MPDVTEGLPATRGRRRLLLLAAACALVAAVVVVEIRSPQPGSVADAGMPAISVSGDRIMRGGQPWWFLGYNSFTWSSDCGYPKQRMSVEDVEAWFASMRHDGHGAVRLFFFPGWHVDRLDAAVASAKRHNIYLILTLDNGIEGCGAEKKDEAWFADDAARAEYRTHMTSLLERYRGETAIAWFEYFNEPGFAGGALRRFYDEMGALAASVDPARLFSSGTIAAYAVDGEENFRTLNESPGVDVASLHEYDADRVESQHGPVARANSAGKPVIVGEFGIYASRSGDGVALDGRTCKTDTEQRMQLFAAKAAAYTVTGGYAGALAWAWHPGEEHIDMCATANLADDPGVKEVLRTAGGADKRCWSSG